MESYCVKVCFNVTKDGEPFANAENAYHGLSYEQMSAMEAMLLKGVLELIDAGVKAHAAQK